MIKTEVLGIMELNKTLDNSIKKIDIKGLNKYRGEKFIEFTKEMVRNGQLNIKGISPITRFLAGQHDPLWVKGNLLNKMKVVVNEDSTADAGFFEDGNRIPGKEITYTKLAQLQQSGYRIPLFGDKGRKVRNWLAAQGVDLGKFGASVKSSERYLIVPPRPFMLRAFNSYTRKGKDLMAAKEFLVKKGVM
jgi:hypothetical protein